MGRIKVKERDALDLSLGRSFPVHILELLDILEVEAAAPRQVMRSEHEKQTLRAAQELLGQQTEETKEWDCYSGAEPEPPQRLPEKGELSLPPQQPRDHQISYFGVHVSC